MTVSSTNPSGAWYPPLAPQPAASGTLAKLATATQALLFACGALALATIGVETFGIVSATAFLDGNDAAVELINAYDQASLGTTVLSGGVLLATAVVWLIWQYRAAKQVAGLTRRSPGWHVGSWLVPVISLWFPFQNISDLWRAVGRTRPSWQIVWWLLWLVSSSVTQLSTRLYMGAQDLEQFRAAMWANAAGQLLVLAATPLAWLIVRGITQGVLGRDRLPAHPSLPAAADGGVASPLSFGADLTRALNGEPAPLGLNGKPVIQPWAVGPGRVIGVIAAIVGLAAAAFVPAVGIAFGLLGFVLSNTAWAHLRNAGRPRTLPLVAQFISGAAAIVGIVALIVGAVLGG